MEHKARLITALILIPLVLGILFAKNIFLLGLLILAASLLAFYEYWEIGLSCQNQGGHQSVPQESEKKDNCEDTAANHGQDTKKIPAILSSHLPIFIISGITAIAMTAGAIYGSLDTILAVLCLNFFMAGIFCLYKFPHSPRIFDTLVWQVTGVIYIFVPLCLALLIGDFFQGHLWLLWILIVTFANDTGAFYVGTTWGKHKLAPAISPKKSMEGSVGGIAGSMLLGFVFALIFFQDSILALKMLPCALILAIAGQLGDLTESAIKRRAGIKDSGKLLPGHGGILDRIDGLLFTLPVAYAYLVFIIQ